MHELINWSIRAVNLPEHADNPVHTDAGAKAAGFERALVAGTTVHGYLTHLPLAAWGLDWLEHGASELRLRKPVFDEELVDCVVVGEPEASATTATGGTTIEAQVDGERRAELTVWPSLTGPDPREGDALPTLDIEVTADRIGYHARGGDVDPRFEVDGLAPPVLWSVLANAVFIEHLVVGPWVHVRSRIFHQGIAKLGDRLTVASTLVDRFDSRAGERALVDIEISCDGRALALIEHEAIMDLA